MSNPVHKILILATASSQPNAESNMFVELANDADRLINHDFPMAGSRGLHRCGLALRATPIKASTYNKYWIWLVKCLHQHHPAVLP